MANTQCLSTLIGDVIDSRRHADRGSLQRSLSDVLDLANERLQPLQPLELAVGDEFQGGFSDVAAAAQATLLLRLTLLVREEGTDSRYGLGYGEVTVFDQSRAPMSQDGPGWWSAREAIERAKRLADEPRTSFVRTCFVPPPDDREISLNAGVMESFLFCRDAIVDRMNKRQRKLLLGSVLGRTQAQLAADEGITQGAVSQSLRRSGAFVIEAAHARLGEVST